MPICPAVTQTSLSKQCPNTTIMNLFKTSALPLSVFTANGNTFRIRRMGVDDYPSVRALIPSVSRCNRTHSSDQISKLIDDGYIVSVCVYTLQDDTETQLVGYAELVKVPHLGRSWDGRLERVIVHPQWRKNGIGNEISIYITKIAKELGLGRIDLTVERDEALRLYTKNGYQTVDTTCMRIMLADL
eukprot:GHVO01010717.1.p1 GENE.GHVO01010717.1~~GHVO01010717.1.p1  ORF type:complete len:187 (-),score=13.74 GHVO01010717.1:77-637(-)